MKFSFKDFFSKCDQIRRKLWIWSYQLKKSFMEFFVQWLHKVGVSNKIAYDNWGIPINSSE